MPFKNYKRESRDKEWGTDTEGSLNRDQLQLGALLRIADSLEKMERPYSALLREVQQLWEDVEDWRQRYRKETEHLRHQNAGLKATITRMKKARRD